MTLHTYTTDGRSHDYTADDATRDLAKLHADQIKLDVDTTLVVGRARRLGLSWAQIGDQLNLSKQTAWQRWRYLDDSYEDE